MPVLGSYSQAEGRADFFDGGRFARGAMNRHPSQSDICLRGPLLEFSHSGAEPQTLQCRRI
jgi:hypothetical protein